MSPIVIGIIVLAILILIPMAVKILPEYQRGVIFRLGRLIGAKGPGLFLIVPLIDRVIKVDLRVVELDISSLEIVNRDDVNVQTGATIKFKVVDPVAATVKVPDHVRKTSEVSQDVFRNLLVQSARDELVRLNEVSKTLQRSIDKQTREWGVEVTEVEVKKMLFGEKYKCNVCGNEAVVTKVGGGALVCCGQEMAKNE